MTYVDLNPIRAGLADDLEGSDFTTIQRRLRAPAAQPATATEPLRALAGESDVPTPSISTMGYIDLVDWTGRMARPDKRGLIHIDAPAALADIRGSPDWWAGCVFRIEGVFGTAVGLPRTLKDHASATGRKWLRGL